MPEENKVLKQLKQAYIFTNSITTPASVNLVHTASSYQGIFSIAQASLLPGIHIEKGVLISCPNMKGNAEVLNPFHIKIQPTDDGFVTTSDISDVYEVGNTIKQATLNYLYSLVDELIWFQEHKDSFSRPMLKDLAKLQLYLRLV